MPARAGADPVTLRLAVVAILLVLTSLAVRLAADVTGAQWAVDLRTWVDADVNGRIPVAFESLCLLAAGIACWVIARRADRAGDRLRVLWGSLTVFLGLLAVEKAFSLHEAVAALVADRWGWIRGGILGTFVIPALIVGAIVAWRMRPLIPTLPTDLRRRLGWGVLLLVGGGLGIELIEVAWIKWGGGTDAVYVVLANVEEGGEMLGSAILAGALWRHVRGTWGPVAGRRVAIAQAPSPDAQGTAGDASRTPDPKR